jgi:hypothetical protein
MKTLHWECSCNTSGDVGYLTWDFQTVASEIVRQHGKVCPYTGYRTLTRLPSDLDIEVSEDLSQAKMRHIQ